MTATPYLYASYRCVSVAYTLGAHVSHQTMYDAAIYRGTEVVWHEDRPHGKLCVTQGAATRRAREVLRRALEAPWSPTACECTLGDCHGHACELRAVDTVSQSDGRRLVARRVCLDCAATHARRRALLEGARVNPYTGR